MGLLSLSHTRFPISKNYSWVCSLILRCHYYINFLFTREEWYLHFYILQLDKFKNVTNNLNFISLSPICPGWTLISTVTLKKKLTPQTLPISLPHLILINPFDL
jgi:hypothetical protein